MDKKQIVKQASQLKSKEDLLNLLNRIKRDEIEEMGFDAFKFHPFTMRHLNYYCNPNNVFHRYRQFHIKKKSGGSRVFCKWLEYGIVVPGWKRQLYDKQ